MTMSVPLGTMEALAFSSNIRSGKVLKVAFEPLIAFHAKRIEELGVGIRSFREPLEISVREVMRPSIRTNFDVGGRPQWAALAEATIEKRLKKGTGTKILVEHGKLRRVASQRNIWDITATVAIIKGFTLLERVPYAGFHQTGTGKGLRTIGESRSSSTATTVTSTLTNESGKTIFGVGDVMPARPYLMIHEEDIVEIEKIFLRWLELRIAKYWARKG